MILLVYNNNKMQFLAAANAFELNGTALFFIIVGGIILWLVMTFLFAHMDSGVVEIEIDPAGRKAKKQKYIKIDEDTEEEDEKEKVYREKKRRQRRKELLRRLLITLKKTGVLLLESSWMIGLSIAIILTVYFITQNMLIE